MDKSQFIEKINPHLLALANELYDYSQNKEKRKKESWWASDLGKCLSGAFYARKGFEPLETPQFVQNIGHEGKMKELEMLVRLILEGADIVDTQKRLYNEEYDISGRPDAIIRLQNPILPENRYAVEEIKTVNSRSFWYRFDKEKNVFNPYEHHLQQLMFYLHELRNDFPNVFGRLRYRSRDDGTEMIVAVAYSEEVWNKVKGQLELLNQAWRKDKAHFLPLPELVVWDEVKKKYVLNWQAQYCEYHHYCMNDKDWLQKAKGQIIRMNKNLSK